jgi:hypothetical protein
MFRSRRPRVSVKDWPRLTRFYGIPPSELVRMPNALTLIYAEALEDLHAEETRLAMLVSDMPHMSEADRKKARRPFAVADVAKKIDHGTEGGRAQAAALGIGVHIPIESTEEPDPRKELA